MRLAPDANASTTGSIEISDSTGESISGGAGLLAIFDPNERRGVTARDDSRIVLILSPWPGEGHPSNPST